MDVRGKLDELSAYLENVKIPGIDMNIGEAAANLSLTGFGTAVTYWVATKLAPAFAAGPAGGVVALAGGAYLAKEISQAAKIPAAMKDPTKYMIAGAALVVLASIFMPEVLFGQIPHYAGQALQSVITLVK